MYRSDDWISDLYHREKLNKKKEISKNYLL